MNQGGIPEIWLVFTPISCKAISQGSFFFFFSIFFACVSVWTLVSEFCSNTEDYHAYLNKESFFKPHRHYHRTVVHFSPTLKWCYYGNTWINFSAAAGSFSYLPCIIGSLLCGKIVLRICMNKLKPKPKNRQLNKGLETAYFLQFTVICNLNCNLLDFHKFSAYVRKRLKKEWWNLMQQRLTWLLVSNAVETPNTLDPKFPITPSFIELSLTW